MKKIFSLISLAFCLLTTSCQPDEKMLVDKEIKFSFTKIGSNESAGGRLSAVEDPRNLIVTIKDNSGTIVADRKELTLYKFGETYLSLPLTLKISGDSKYHLSEFFVTDQNNEIIYVTPKKGSLLAHLVADALDIEFSVSKDIVTTVTPEVIAANDTSNSDDYGYGQFGFNVVKTIKTVFSSFIKGTSNFELTTSHLKVEGLKDSVNGDSTAIWSYEIDLEAKANIISLKQANAYRIIATKTGFKDWVKTITLNNNDKIEILFEKSDTIIEKIWNNHFGGSGTESMTSNSIATSDGGVIIFGGTSSNDYDAPAAKGASFYSDIWIIKLNSSGSLEWKKRYGGYYNDDLRSAVACPDGSGYLLTGMTQSYDGDFVGFPSIHVYGWSGYLMKIDKQGTLLWTKFSDKLFDHISVSNTAPNIFLLASILENDTRNGSYRSSMALRQIDGNGSTLWEKTYSAANTYGLFIRLLYPIDNGYIIAGLNTITKINMSGDILWQKPLSTTLMDNALFSEVPGGYLFFGVKPRGDYFQGGDVIALKLDYNGNQIWEKVVSNTDGKYLKGITKMHSGNFMLVGTAVTTKLTPKGNPSEYEPACIMQVTSEGELIKQNYFGGASFNFPPPPSAFSSAIQTSDSEFILTGYTTDIGGDIPGNYGQLYSYTPDYWAMKLKL